MQSYAINYKAINKQNNIPLETYINYVIIKKK